MRAHPKHSQQAGFTMLEVLIAIVVLSIGLLGVAGMQANSLKNNHAAMITRCSENGELQLVYASEKRQQVITFNSHHVVYEVYWLKHLKGFYRLTGEMITSTAQ